MQQTIANGDIAGASGGESDEQSESGEKSRESGSIYHGVILRVQTKNINVLKFAWNCNCVPLAGRVGGQTFTVDVGIVSA
jgi:hypothetical protein